MKRLSWPGLALAALLAAAFFVQATSTWKLGQRQHVADIALPALVVLLELGSVTSAAIFFRARRSGLRVRALLMLALTAGLGGVGGVAAYGWIIGLPVAILLLGLVEVIGAYRREQVEPIESIDRSGPVDREPEKKPTEPEQSEAPTAVDSVVDAAPVIETGPPTEPLPRQIDTVPVELRHAAAVAWPGPHVEPPQTLAVVGYRPPEPTDEWSIGAELDRDDEPEPWGGVEDVEVPERPDVETRARELIEQADTRPSESQLHAALLAEGYDVTKYRCKKWLGNKTRRLEAVS